MTAKGIFTWHEELGQWTQATGGTTGGGSPPPPPPGGCLFGATPYSGESDSDVNNMDIKFGVQAPVIRLYWTGATSGSPHPDYVNGPTAGRNIVGSFKTMGSNTATWAPHMWRWYYQHEIDHKIKIGAITLAQWQSDMAALVALGIPGLGVCITDDALTNPAKNPNDYLVPGVNFWGIDFDGISSNTGYHDYTSAINAAVSFTKKNGLTWGVPEFSANNAATSDPNDTGRAVWLTNTSHQLAAAGAEFVCWWEDATNQPPSVLTKAVSIQAEAALFTQTS